MYSYSVSACNAIQSLSFPRNFINYFATKLTLITKSGLRLNVTMLYNSANELFMLSSYLTLQHIIGERAK